MKYLGQKSERFNARLVLTKVTIYNTPVCFTSVLRSRRDPRRWGYFSAASRRAASSLAHDVIFVSGFA